MCRRLSFVCSRLFDRMCVALCAVRVSLGLCNICCCFKKHFMWNLSTNWNSWHSSKVVFQLVYSIMNSIQKVFGGDICLSWGVTHKFPNIKMMLNFYATKRVVLMKFLRNFLKSFEIHHFSYRLFDELPKCYFNFLKLIFCLHANP